MKALEHNEGLIGIHSFVAYKGDLEYDEYGNVKNEVVFVQPETKNLIVTNGKNLALDRLFAIGGPPAAISHVGVGTDSTAADVSQTQLNPSVVGSVAIRAADSGTSRSGQTVTIQATFGTSEANFNWQEAALFNGGTNGTSTMFNRVVIGPFNKTSAVSIVYRVQVTQS